MKSQGPQQISYMPPRNMECEICTCTSILVCVVCVICISMVYMCVCIVSVPRPTNWKLGLALLVEWKSCVLKYMYPFLGVVKKGVA